MKSKLLALVLLAVVPASSALAHEHDADLSRIHFLGCDPPVRWSDRISPRDADFTITTQNGDATLLLTDRVVALQLSDRKLHEIRRHLRETREEGADEDNVLARSIKNVVISSVSAVLEGSADISIRDIREMDYQQGRLHLVVDGGDRVFDHVDVDDQDVMSGFSDRDAREFVREFHRIKRHER